MRWLRSPEPTCSFRDSACTRVLFARVRARAARAFSSDSARARFLCWLRSSWHSTTMPVGRCVMRIAESVLLTCWPPAPDARNVSTFRSAALISTSSISSTSGRIATVAADVWMRPCASVVGYALHAMRAGFEFEARERALAFDARDDFLVAAVLAFAGRKNLDVPASPFGVARVHAKADRRRRSRLRRRRCRRAVRETGSPRRADPSGSAARFRSRSSVRARLRARRSRRGSAFNSGSSSIARADSSALPVSSYVAQRRRQRRKLRMLARDIAKAFRIGEHLGTREQMLELLMALGELVEFAADRGLHGGEYRRVVASREKRTARRSGESRDPVVSNRRQVRRWVPAFAGTTRTHAQLTLALVIAAAHSNRRSAARSRSASPRSAAARRFALGACRSLLVSVLARNASASSGVTFRAPEAPAPWPALRRDRLRRARRSVADGIVRVERAPPAHEVLDRKLDHRLGVARGLAARRAGFRR